MTTNSDKPVNVQPAQTIDQVKELLFGSEQRDLKDRIQALETELLATRKQLEKAIDQLRLDSEKSNEAIKQANADAIGSIGNLLQTAGKGISELAK